MSDNSDAFEFWLVGVMLTMVSMLGICGNLTSILMFQYKKLSMNQTIASLLKWLAVIDSVFLVMMTVFILVLLSAVAGDVFLCVFTANIVPSLQGMDIPPYSTHPPTSHQHSSYR